jgi:hypothetical protein
LSIFSEWSKSNRDKQIQLYRIKNGIRELFSLKILTCMKRAHSYLSCMGNYAKITRAPTRAEMMTMADAAEYASLEIPAAALAEARAAEPSVPHFVSMVSIYLSCEMWQRQNNQ